MKRYKPLFENEKYDRKRNYADRKMSKNAEIETLSPEQHNILSYIAKIRHDIHVNQESLFYSESSSHETFTNFLDSEIHNLLQKVKLPKIKLSVKMMDFPVDYDVSENLTSNSMEEHLEEALKQTELINKDIEKYLRDIDKKHGTEYAPTGLSRGR